MALSEAHESALAEMRDALENGNTEKAQEIASSLHFQDTEAIEETAEDFVDGNPDEELAEAIEELEPAAGEVAEAALEAGRPDLAAEVVEQTLATLADWAESGEELAETLEEVAAEIEDESAMETASEAADTMDEATEAVTETLEEAGVPEVIAEAEVDPANGTEEFVEMDVAPEPSHWLYRRRRFGGRV